MQRTFALVACLSISACSVAAPIQHDVLPSSSLARAASTSVLDHQAIGFSVDTPARAVIASRQGVTATILYNGLPAPGSALAVALREHGISAIDGSISNYLDRWECYRIKTVKPPPSAYPWNCYPSQIYYKSVAQLLAAIKPLVERDAKLGASGYWILDDWPYWDPGSAHNVLPQIRSLIAGIAPGKPAICGFAGTVGKAGYVGWDKGTGYNYSNAGCDAVGWYNYSNFGITTPSNGNALDWTMKALLSAQAATLHKYGWVQKTHPLIGIGQAWGGHYDGKYYQPGLSTAQMRTQAQAFCRFGATSISWYAWDDSGWEAGTETPETSTAVADGVVDGLAACRSVWKTASDS